MQKIIGVRFKRAGKIYFFDPGEDEIEKGDSVIVDTSRGLECGAVVIGTRELPQSESTKNLPPIRRIHRKATRADLARVEENHRQEDEAFRICLEKIAEHKLPMHLISVRYTFDMNKVIFYFTAEGRVDFRMLVRDLAYIFKTRIELRQVGVREEARHLGGVGCCGRKLCCASFLGDFAQVSIRMAKEQNLSLNPTKISGICGRLLCCLKFESEYYHECYVATNPVYEPHQNDRVIVDDGEGRVVSLNLTRRTATILLDSGKTLVSSWEELIPVDSESTGKFPTADNDSEEIITENAQPEREESDDTETPAKPVNRTKNLEDKPKPDESSKAKPWIKRPRKPRRPHGNSK